MLCSYSSSDFFHTNCRKGSHFLPHLVHAINCYKFGEVYNTSKGLWEFVFCIKWHYICFDRMSTRNDLPWQPTRVNSSTKLQFDQPLTRELAMVVIEGEHSATGVPKLVVHGRPPQAVVKFIICRLDMNWTCNLLNVPDDAWHISTCKSAHG